MSERTKTHRGMNYVVSIAHPAAEAFPWLNDDELQNLADHIAAKGQKEDIQRLPDERIVDGRNRELACRIAGVVPRYVTVKMTEDEIIDLVEAHGVHRRNLTPSQLAMAAATLANLRNGSNQHETRNATNPCKKVVGVPRGTPTLAPISQTTAGKKLGVSRRSVNRAAKVKDKAPELVEPVKEGKLDVNTASRIADLPAPMRKKVAESDDPKEEAKKQLAEPSAVKIIPPPTVDAWGIPIQDHATEAFEAVAKFTELNKLLRQAAKLWHEVASLPGGSFLAIPGVSKMEQGRKQEDGTYADRYVHKGLDQAIRDVKVSRPTHTVCPYQYADAPHSPECTCCRGLNWTPVLGNSIPKVCIDRAKAAFGVKEEDCA